jgi:hypothetical protein
MQRLFSLESILETRREEYARYVSEATRWMEDLQAIPSIHG